MELVGFHSESAGALPRYFLMVGYSWYISGLLRAAHSRNPAPIRNPRGPYPATSSWWGVS